MQELTENFINSKSIDSSSFSADFSLNNSFQETNHDSSETNHNILCRHCSRTAKNQIRCLGMCVEDSEY